MKDPQKLLQAYATEQSEEAFSTLVSSYIDLVYSVAKRQVNGDSHLAQDITQTVFSDLAEKAGSFSKDIQLGGWLHRHTCFAASNHRRSERRRLNRETQAMQMETLTPTEEEGWRELAPELDLAINQLNEPDRSAIVMRFFERKNHRDIGLALSTSENSAQKRVTRAIDKLRSILAQQGVALSGPMLALLIENNGLASPPEGLALQISCATQQLATIAVTTPRETQVQSIPSVLKIAASLAASFAVIALIIFQGDEKPKAADETNNTIETASPRSQSLENPNGGEQGEFSSIVAMPHNPENFQSLKLIIQSKETSERLSGVRIQHRAQLIDRWDVKTLTANRAGEISIPFELDQLKMLQLITQIEGYADTRLEWHPSQGDSIPPEFTLELNPAIRIGGSVVDTSGQPVSGAKVGFNHEDLEAIRTRPLSFEFGWIEVETDDEGRWEINRIATDMIPLIYGRARHSDFVNSQFLFTRHDRMLVKELRSGTHRITLTPALRLSGIVTDEHDVPIPNTEIRYGRLGSGDSFTTESDLEGRFLLTGCNPGSELLTANADQYAPKTITVEAAPKSPEIRVSLERGRRAIIRVRDSHGDPISGAIVRYNNHDSVDPFDPLTMSWGAPHPAIQIDFTESTDSEGLITWFDAPNQTLVFSVSAKGFIASKRNQFKPDGREHDIILQPALVVTGTIIDEVTRTPIAKAQMITGWIDSRGTENPSPKWSTLGRFRIDFSGGEFHHSYYEPVTREILNPVSVLRFEAEGYQPFVTRRIKASEGVVTLNIELKQSRAQKISVFLPDGQPAVQADIAFLATEGRVTVTPGGLSRERSGFGWTMPFTDSKGQFELTPDPAITWVIAAHEEGFKQVELQDLQENSQIELAPWGALEVTAPIHANSDPRTTLELAFVQTHHGVQIDYKGYATDLKSDGSYHFDKIPQGTHHLEFRVMSTKPREQTWTIRLLKQITINAGETTQVTLQGIRISARLHLPADLENHHIAGLIHKPFEQIPLDVVNVPAQAAAWIANNRPLTEEPIRLKKHTDTIYNILTANNVTLTGDIQLSIGLYEELNDRTLLLARSLINLTIPDDGAEQSINVDVTDWEYAIVPED